MKSIKNNNEDTVEKISADLNKLDEFLKDLPDAAEDVFNIFGSNIRIY